MTVLICGLYIGIREYYKENEVKPIDIACKILNSDLQIYTGSESWTCVSANHLSKDGKSMVYETHDYDGKTHKLVVQTKLALTK